MDQQAWYRLLMHLASHAQTNSFLKGFVTQHEGQIHLILGDASEQANAAQFKEVVEELLNDPETVAHLTSLLEDAGGKVALPQVVALIVNMQHASEKAEYDQGPRTLRESIDREWPW